MPQYTCPKCKTVLKRSEPVPAGKKIKCPKCAEIFAPGAAVAAGKSTAEDYDRTPYSVQEEKEEEDTVKKEKQRAAMGLVRDRFVKSKRGPATARVTIPANLLTAAGVFMAVGYIALFIIGVFPMVFKDYYLDFPGYKKWSPEQQQAYWENLVMWRCIMMGGAVFGFIIASLVCIGAFHMRTIGSYAWAMTGAVLTTIFGLVWSIVGIWCLIVLRNEVVIEGFAEEPPPPHTGIT